MSRAMNRRSNPKSSPVPVEQLATSGAAIATVAHPIVDSADFFNPNVVKVVCRGMAMRFIFLVLLSLRT